MEQGAKMTQSKVKQVTIYLTDGQYAWLKQESAATLHSKASIIRDALVKIMEQQGAIPKRSVETKLDFSYVPVPDAIPLLSTKTLEENIRFQISYYNPNLSKEEVNKVYDIEFPKWQARQGVK